MNILYMYSLYVSPYMLNILSTFPLYILKNEFEYQNRIIYNYQIYNLKI